jgi:cell division protein FtsQ
VRQSLAILDVEPPRRAVPRRRRGNRRVVIQRTPILVALAEGVGALGRLLWKVCRVVGRVLLALGLLTAVGTGGTLAVRHVLASPRFALTDLAVAPTSRVSREEIVALAAVEPGERLLAIDTDAVAARVAAHPWISEARVRRHLPSALRIDVVERRAAGVVALEGLYLIDEAGRPFKRATTAEAEGLPVLTGIERAHYIEHREVSEAVFREALALIGLWQSVPGRPPLSEVNIHPRYGFSLFLLEGGTEVRLGRGHNDRKLARLDQIFEAVQASGVALGAVRVVHLDGDSNQIPVRLGPEDTFTLEGPVDPGGPAARSARPVARH